MRTIPTTNNPASASQAARGIAAIILPALPCAGLLLAIAVLSGCNRAEYTIPATDGPLVLELRYPTIAPVAVGDSIALWGTVGSGKARLRINGHTVRVEPNGAFATFLPLPPGDAPVLELEASKGGETLHRSLSITRLTTTAPPRPRLRPAHGWIRLRRLPNDTTDSATQARPVFGRWTPGGALALPLPLGVRLRAEVETDSAVRVRLARGTAVWVNRADAEPVAAPRDATALLGDLALTQDGARSVIALAAPEQIPTSVDVVRHHLRWTLYGARAGRAEPVLAEGGLVQRVTMRDMGDGRVLVDVLLVASALGWRTTWRDGRVMLALRPERAAAPGLKGLVVVLDAGHPPEGATGPTGLREDSVNLAVALETAKRLRALGAKPVLTRAGPAPVSLERRVAIAEQADAELFVSIHANAPGDGRPPESVDGTRIYWWNTHALPLARALRDSVPARTGQRRIGTVQSNLAVLRPTWFPAVLVEATALVLPAREAWLRTPEGIGAYAAGIVAGIQAWQAARFAGEAERVPVE